MPEKRATARTMTHSRLPVPTTAVAYTMGMMSLGWDFTVCRVIGDTWVLVEYGIYRCENQEDQPLGITWHLALCRRRCPPCPRW